MGTLGAPPAESNGSETGTSQPRNDAMENKSIDQGSSSPDEPSSFSLGPGRAPAGGRRRRKRQGRTTGSLANVALVVTCAVLVVAPLAVGGVHRIPILLLLAGMGAGLTILSISLALERRTMRVGWVALVPLLFVLIPAWQSIPLPHALRARIDPEGSALLAENPFVAGQAWPLSLDPPITRFQIGKAAAGLAIFLLAFHL